MTQYAIVVDTLCQGIVASKDDIYATEAEAKAELAELQSERARADMDDGGYYITPIQRVGDRYEDDFGAPITITGECHAS